MKITIEPTDEIGKLNERSPKVSITIDGDDHTCAHVIESAIKPALLAWGFHPDTIEKQFDL